MGTGVGVGSGVGVGASVGRGRSVAVGAGVALGSGVGVAILVTTGESVAAPVERRTSFISATSCPSVRSEHITATRRMNTIIKRIATSLFFICKHIL